MLSNFDGMIGQPDPSFAVANHLLQLRNADATRPHANRIERRHLRFDAEPGEDDLQRRFRRTKTDRFGQVQAQRNHFRAVAMMRQRQIARQGYRLLAEFFILLLLLTQELLRLVKLLFCLSQRLLKPLVGRSKFAALCRLVLSPRSLRIATSKEIPGRFVPGGLVLSDRFREKES